MLHPPRVEMCCLYCTSEAFFCWQWCAHGRQKALSLIKKHHPCLRDGCPFLRTKMDRNRIHTKEKHSYSIRSIKSFQLFLRTKRWIFLAGYIETNHPARNSWIIHVGYDFFTVGFVSKHFAPCSAHFALLWTSPGVKSSNLDLLEVVFECLEAQKSDKITEYNQMNWMKLMKSLEFGIHI